MKRMFAVFVVSAATVACSPPASTSTDAPIPIESGPQVAEAPAEVLAAIATAVPGFTVTSAVSDNSTGAQAYRVSGAANGQATEVMVMHTNEGWSVVQTTRDIAWADAPQAVKAALAAAPNAFEPARVVEVRDTGADGVVYDVYAQGSDTPVSIRDVDGQAAIMPAPH